MTSGFQAIPQTLAWASSEITDNIDMVFFQMTYVCLHGYVPLQKSEAALAQLLHMLHRCIRLILVCEDKNSATINVRNA